jgi:hypothetical protein
MYGLKYTKILHFVLYGCETWSLTLREDHISKAFEDRLMWRIFDLKTEEVTRGSNKCIMRSFIICTFPSSNIRIIKSMRGIVAACSTHERDEKCLQNFGWETWREDTT